MSIKALPIWPVKTLTNSQALQTRKAEESGQTFLAGTPLMLNGSDGGVEAWDGTSLTNAIVGFSTEDGHNFSTTGPGVQYGQTLYTGLGAQLTFGHVPNQAAAVNIPRGAPLVDGMIGLNVADQNTIFAIVFGDNGALATPALTDIGKEYGLTIDTASQYWYVDKNKTGASAAVRVVGLDPNTGLTSGAFVLCQVLAAASGILS